MRIPDVEYGTEYAPDGMMPCPECEGNGEVTREQYADYSAWDAAFSIAHDRRAAALRPVDSESLDTAEALANHF
jgi:hypothetical protein